MKPLHSNQAHWRYMMIACFTLHINEFSIRPVLFLQTGCQDKGYSFEKIFKFILLCYFIVPIVNLFGIPLD